MRSKRYPMSILEVQTSLFDVLSEVDTLFRKYNIVYYLMFGTLLGCVRDGGPIKWDDDIDICVASKDWDKANRVLEEGIDREKHFIVNHSTNPNFPYGSYITRVGVNKTYRRMDYFKNKENESGIFIDIYQLVGAPDMIIPQKLWEYEIGIVDGIILLHSIKRGEFQQPKALAYLLYHMTKKRLNTSYWIEKRKLIQNKYNTRKTERLTIPFGPLGVYSLSKTLYNREWFRQIEEKNFIIKNEKDDIIRNSLFYVPLGYRDILETTYGDWHRKPSGRYWPALSFWESENKDKHNYES